MISEQGTMVNTTNHIDFSMILFLDIFKQQILENKKQSQIVLKKASN